MRQNAKMRMHRPKVARAEIDREKWGRPEDMTMTIGNRNLITTLSYDDTKKETFGRLLDQQILVFRDKTTAT